MKRVIAWTLLATVTGGYNVANAVTGGLDAPPQRVVRYGDIDLTRTDGAAALYGRIRHAAHQVCEPLAQVASPSILLVNRCISAAIDRAVDEVGSPLLTDYRRTISLDKQR